MSPHSPTAAPSQPLNLAPGHSLWLCMAPGSTLYAAAGHVAVHWAPQACGDATHTPPHTLLHAGEALPCDRLAQTAWVQLHNPTRRPAELQWTAAAPAPEWWQGLWQRWGSALGHRNRSTPGHRYSDACHAAR